MKIALGPAVLHASIIIILAGAVGLGIFLSGSSTPPDIPAPAAAAEPPAPAAIPPAVPAADQAVESEPGPRDGKLRLKDVQMIGVPADIVGVEFFPRIPVYPGSEFARKDEETRTVIYTTTADRTAVFTFYKEEMERRNPERVKHPGKAFIKERQMDCKVRWHCFEFEDRLFIIKDTEALTISAGERTITYAPIERRLAWAMTNAVTEPEYIKQVYVFGRRITELNVPPEKIEAGIRDLELRYMITLDRLSDFNRDYALGFMRRAQARPDWKARGVPALLGRIHFWDDFQAAVEAYSSEHPQEAAAFATACAAFRQEWSQ